MLELIGLTKRYGERTAVADISLTVDEGSVVGFLGPNGAGKTTTIHMVLGLTEPTEGRVLLGRLDPQDDGPAVRSAIGAVLEPAGVYERLTAEENLEFFGRAWGLPRREREQRVITGLDRWGLGSRRRERVGAFSRGMKQRLALARALMVKPQLLLLDEPTSGLDPLAAAELRETLMAMAREEGMTVFMSTHDLVEAEEICDRVAVINNGRLVFTGTPAELGAGPPEAGRTPTAFRDGILALLRADTVHDAPVHR